MCVRLERDGQRVDGLLRHEDVSLGRAAVAGAAAGPVLAFLTGEGGRTSGAVDDAELVLPLVADSVGLQPDTRDLTTQLATRLDQGSSLIVLDTFERLLPAGPVHR